MGAIVVFGLLAFSEEGLIKKSPLSGFGAFRRLCGLRIASSVAQGCVLRLLEGDSRLEVLGYPL